ncbi:Pectinacetylesterase-domain-containing protein, partial [Pavlovales sp. CCMP2436]
AIPPALSHAIWSLTRTAHAVAAVAAVALTLAALGTLRSQAPPELVAPQPPRAENTTELANECSLANEYAGDMLGSVPIPSVVPHPAFSAAKFACTPDNVSPKSAGPPVSFVPCCTGSAPVNITRTESVCKPTTPTTNKFLECVSSDIIPLASRCDLTDTTGETSCPLSAMVPNGSYLIYPGGLAACYHQPTATGWGTCSVTSKSNRFSFEVKKGNPTKLLVYFQGGGACWTTTDGKPVQACTTHASAQTSPTFAAYYSGMLDSQKADNRYANFTQVKLPYCSGDVFAGNVTQAFSSKEYPNMPIKQVGYANARAVLDWLLAQESIKQIDELVIAGMSAGSLGAQVWTRPLLLALQANSKQRISSAMIYDSFVGVFPVFGTRHAAGLILRDSWRVCSVPEFLPTPEALAACNAGTIEFTDVMLPAIKKFPETLFTFIQSKEDIVQVKSAVLTIIGKDHVYKIAMSIIESYRALSPNVSATLVNGNCHTFSELPDWSDATAGGPGAARTVCPAEKWKLSFEVGIAELVIIGEPKGGQLVCCKSPGSTHPVSSLQLLAYMKLSNWVSPPLVSPGDARPGATPPLWAKLMDNCYGPINSATQPLYSCPSFINYVTNSTKA